MIHKILTAEQFATFQKELVFRGSDVDLNDGFIHFSDDSQLQGTLEKHFSGQVDLMLISVDPDEFGESLRWEVSRGGEKFPHLYDVLSWSSVQASREIEAPQA